MINRGIRVEGKTESTVYGKIRICEKDNEYVIPAKATHYARFLSKSRVIDFSPEKTRYRTTFKSYLDIL